MAWNPSGGGGGPWGGGGSGGGSGGGGPWGGGGSSGGGGRDPWGRGGGGPIPDLDALIRKAQERMRNLFSGGAKGGVLLVVGLVMAWFLWDAVYRVQPDEQGVEMVFGAFTRTTPPGLHINWPAPIGKVYKPRVTRINRIEVGFRSVGEGRGARGSSIRDVPEESLVLTGDENILDIDFFVLWRIKDASRFLFKVRDPQGTVKVAAESAMREVIGKTRIQQALTEGRKQIEQMTHGLLQEMLDHYEAGIEVVEVNMQKADPPAQVVDAFNDVQRAKADRERLSNEAEAYRNDIIPRARGESERLLQEAQAYKEQVTNLAEGDSKRFLSVYSVYAKAPEVTARRIYIDTLEQILKNTHKVIIDKQATGSGILPYLPLPELRPGAPAPGGKP